jgi:hypothetical protein
MATIAIFAGPFLLGSAVADTVAGMVDVEPDETIAVVTAALVAALAWNAAAWYRGIPSSSSHALIGGLVGAALATAGLDAVNWGGFDGLRPVGVLGVLVVLATSPIVGATATLIVLRVYRRVLRRGTRRFSGPVLDAQWVTSTLLSVGQGANDAQKAVGLVAAVLLAHGTTSSLEAPLWVVLRRSPWRPARSPAAGGSCARSADASTTSGPSTRSPARPDRRPQSSAPRSSARPSRRRTSCRPPWSVPGSAAATTGGSAGPSSGRWG